MTLGGADIDHALIDVHFHLYPDFYREVVNAHGPRGIAEGAPDWSCEGALQTMDSLGIEAAILSISYPGVHFGNAEAAQALARRCNTFAAEMGVRWPGRFGSFAVLPLPDIDRSLAELAFAFDQLGADGVVLLASYGDTFLGDPVFEPLMDELNRRNAVVFVHPGSNSAPASLGWPGFAMEFLFDTSRAAFNLLFSGTLRRYPDIRFILAHAGGTIPYFAWRLAVAPQISKRLPQWSQRDISEGLASFWYDTALSPSKATSLTLREVAGPSRILYGSDYPFVPAAARRQAVDIWADSIAEPAERTAARSGNARALFPRFAART